MSGEVVPTVDRVTDLFVATTEWCRMVSISDRLRAAFLEVGPFGESDVLPVADTLRGLASALHYSRVGISVDYGEGFLFGRLAHDVVDIWIGTPDPGELAPLVYEPFRFDGENVEAGLVAFDRWLLDVNSQWREPLRVLSIDTGSDSYLAMVCESDVVETAVSMLDGLGIGAGLVR